MPKIAYIDKTFSAKSRETILQANQIIATYRAQGFDLTLRQLYYQFVARGLIANRDTEYKRLGSIINEARLAGLIDWNAIEDRTRNLRGVGHWNEPSDIMRAVADQFRQDKWRTQPNRVEVWIEKDALVGVIADVCERLDVSYFSCRGYVSQSEMWGAARRLDRYLDYGQQPVILHFGDHDPSGIDMTRDIRDRLNMFVLHDSHEAVEATVEAYQGHRDEYPVEVRRMALNMDQVRQYNPPPNPAKLTDSRCYDYIRRHGDESWELDALEPAVIARLIEDEVDSLCDPDRWDEAVDEEDTHRAHLAKVSEHWDAIAGFLETL